MIVTYRLFDANDNGLVESTFDLCLGLNVKNEPSMCGLLTWTANRDVSVCRVEVDVGNWTSHVQIDRVNIRKDDSVSVNVTIVLWLDRKKVTAR